MKLDFNYDTQSSFDFDRQIKLGFDSVHLPKMTSSKKLEKFRLGNLIQNCTVTLGPKTELSLGVYLSQRAQSTIFEKVSVLKRRRTRTDLPL